MKEQSQVLFAPQEQKIKKTSMADQGPQNQLHCMNHSVGFQDHRKKIRQNVLLSLIKDCQLHYNKLQIWESIKYTP